MKSYRIYDNKNNCYDVSFENDLHAKMWLALNWEGYICSFLSNEPILLVNENCYILATVNTATGEMEIRE